MKCLLILITYFGILTLLKTRIDQELSKLSARQSDQDEEVAEDGDNDDTNESVNDETNNDQHEETDDWMLLSSLNQHYEQSGDLLLENGTDWFEEARPLPMELLRECPWWISKQRKDAEERGRQHLTAQLQNSHPAIDPTTLNEKQ